MIGRRAIVGLCLLCALLVSALAAQGASALEVKGTTAFTCVKGKGTLHGEHCLKEGSAAAEYGHVAIAEGETTEATATNEKTKNETKEAEAWKLKMTIGGVSTTFTIGEVHGEGILTNKLDAETEKTKVKNEHYIHVLGRLHLTKVTANHGCQIYNDENRVKGAKETVTTQELTATTTEQGDAVRIKPVNVGPIATYFLEECEKGFESLNGTYEVTGSVKGTPEGATVSFSHASVTAEETLKTNGIKIGIEGKLTVSARKNSTQATTPISPTTVET